VRFVFSSFAFQWFQVKYINARLEGIQPKVQSSNGISSGYNIPGEINSKKSSPKAKISSKETSRFGG
jgi:CLIP-associating protein 1/2